MNIGEWVLKRARTHPQRPFLKHGGLAFDNRQFNARVNRLAHLLATFDVGKGQRVATLMANGSAFLELLFACAKTGALLVPLNTKLALPEMTHIIADSAPQLLVYSPSFGERVRALLPGSPAIAHCLCDGPGAAPGHADMANLALSFPEAEPLVAEAVEIRDPLLIMYTSGTTGAPKGAVLSHENILFGAIHSLIGFGLSDSCRSLVVAPLFHIGALAASATPVIYAGGSLVIEPFDNPSEVIELITRERINYLFAVPVMFEMLTKSPRWEKADFSHVHFFISGGAPMPLPLIRKIQHEKGIRLSQGYGMTETLRLTALDLEDVERKAGSVGKEVFHTFLRIVDDQGGDLPAGEIGEILVRGPTVFDTYWNKESESRNAFCGDWFRTGDLGRRDEEGFVFLSGRKIDLIISSGENIYAAEVERAIEALPQVAQAAVIGLPDPRRGEVVAACVRLKAAQALSEAALLEGLEGKIADFKLPRKIFFVEDFPRNSAGKILKRELKAGLKPGVGIVA